MKSILCIVTGAALTLFSTGCSSTTDSRAEQDNHRQGVSVAGRPEKASGDVGQNPR
jgi:hypothetical protein